MFIAALFTIAKRWKPPKCPSTYKWINKMWSIDIQWNIIQPLKGKKFWHYNMNKPWRHYAKWNKPDTKEQVLHTKSLQSYPALWDPMDYSPPGSSVCGILQARIPEWVAMPSSRGSSHLRDIAWFQGHEILVVVKFMEIDVRTMVARGWRRR